MPRCAWFWHGSGLSFSICRGTAIFFVYFFFCFLLRIRCELGDIRLRAGFSSHLLFSCNPPTAMNHTAGPLSEREGPWLTSTFIVYGDVYGSAFFWLGLLSKGRHDLFRRKRH